MIRHPRTTTNIRNGLLRLFWNSNALDFLFHSSFANRGFAGNAQALATSVDHDDVDVARHLRSMDLFSASLSSFGVRLEFA